MNRTLLLAIFFVLCAILCAPSAYSSSYASSYKLYLNLAKDAFDAGDYKHALWYFEAASAIDPSQPKPQQYINLIKRIREGRSQKIAEAPARKSTAKKIILASRAGTYPTSRELITTQNPVKESIPQRIAASEVNLDDELWQRQPNMPIEMEMNKFLILSGRNIQRYLIVTEGFIRIERIDKDRIKISAFQRGMTFLHVWDDRGRWTFNVSVILPISETNTIRKDQATELVEDQEEPFKFTYSNTWNAYYRGHNATKLKRQSLSFPQYFGVYGKTPYGNAYATANYYNYNGKTVRIGQAFGLNEGSIGPFKDFSLRGHDTSTQFSDLSLPERSFRGELLDAYAFNHDLKYTVFHGQDRASYLFIVPGLVNVQKSYIEGGKVTLFPDTPNKYSFNYAHGYGPIRDRELKDKVYSIEAQHKFADLLSYAELGYDTDVYAWNFNNFLKNDDSSLRFNFRNIDKEYYTIVGRPTAQGEIGGNLIWDWRPQNFSAFSNLDIYRDRLSPNAEHPDKVNFNSNTSVEMPINETSRLATSVYYINAPQQLSPLEDFRIDSRYSKNLRFFNNREITTYLGANYQINRTSDNTSTEYDRTGLTAGFRFYPLPQLAYYASYSYYWVKELASDNTYQPQALETGASYSRRLLDLLNSQIGVTYRKEIESQNNFSFLSGDDSIRGNLNLTYNPYRDLNVYLDSQLQNIFPANSANDSYVDANIILGVRSSWDLPFSWSPCAEINGNVYKDINGNSVRDKEETGLAGVIVKVGRHSVLTDRNGFYTIKVRAKRLRVRVDSESLPEGYVSSTALAKDITIENQKIITVDFGVTNRTSIYGVVFYDKNSNGKVDPSEEVIPNVRIVLDRAQAVRTDGEGSYLFEGLAAGQHRISIDVNSLPIKYIPRITVTKKIEVADGTTYLYYIPLGRNP